LLLLEKVTGSQLADPESAQRRDALRLEELLIEFRDLVSDTLDASRCAPLVLTHHNLRPVSLLATDSGFLFDGAFELVAYNYQAVDLAMHFQSCAGEGAEFKAAAQPSKKEQELFVAEYLAAFRGLANDEAVTDADVQALCAEVERWAPAAWLLGSTIELCKAVSDPALFSTSMATAEFQIREYQNLRQRLQ